LFHANANAAGEAHSGFLGSDENHARLHKVVLKNGKPAMRWVADGLSVSNYQQIIIDPVQLYPKPEPSEQVSEATLADISAYLTKVLKTKFGRVMELTERPGSNVLRLQAAVTGVVVKTEGMKAYEVIPLAAVFGAAKAATGTRDMDVRVRLEARLVDSVSGELQGMLLRVIEGQQLKGKKEQLSLDDVKENLDTVSDGATTTIEGIVK